LPSQHLQLSAKDQSQPTLNNAKELFE